MLIDRNAGRYIELFADNEDKKCFVNLNWAACFFPELWLLYRRMFSYAFLKLLVSIVLMVAVVLGCYISFLPRINKIMAQPDVVEPPSIEHLQGCDQEVIDSYIEEYTRRNSKQAQLSAVNEIIKIIVFLSNLIFNFIFSLFSDCIYRRYILRHTKGSGGVSFVAVIIPIAIMGIYIFAKIIGFQFDVFIGHML